MPGERKTDSGRIDGDDRMSPDRDTADNTSSRSGVGKSRFPVLLRRADQVAIASLTLLAIVSMAGYWLAHGGRQGRLIDIDREQPRQALFQVDVNRAGWPELAQLPEIGETLARRIVESRSDDGPFVDHDDLRRVRGIGPKTLDRMRPYLRPIPSAENIAGR